MPSHTMPSHTDMVVIGRFKMTSAEISSLDYVALLMGKIERLRQRARRFWPFADPQFEIIDRNGYRLHELRARLPAAQQSA